VFVEVGGIELSKTVGESVDKRVLRSKETVLAETYELLWEAGLGGVSVDEISRRSGVSKTTIYRHWLSRSALLLDACSKLSPKPKSPETGSLKRDLTALVRHLGDQLRTARWSAVLPSIIDAAERDPEIATLHTNLQAEMNAPFFQAVEQAKKRGELAAGEKTADIVAAVIGPLFYRRWHSREEITDHFLKQVVKNVTGRLKASATQ